MNSSKIENKTGWFVGGGIIASILASLCCIGPLILTILGVSGAAAIAKLDVIRIPMIILVIAIFLFTGVLLFHKRKHCEPGSICADPHKFKKIMIFYWIGLVFALLGITSPEWITWFY